MTNAPAMQQPKKTEGEGVSTASRRKDEEGRTPEDVRRADAIRELVECERRNNRSSLATCSRDTMRSSLELRREDLSGIHLADTNKQQPCLSQDKNVHMWSHWHRS